MVPPLSEEVSEQKYTSSSIVEKLRRRSVRRTRNVAKEVIVTCNSFNRCNGGAQTHSITCFMQMSSSVGKPSHSLKRADVLSFSLLCLCIVASCRRSVAQFNAEGDKDYSSFSI